MRRVVVLALTVGACLVAAFAGRAAAEEVREVRVLLVGNSYTRFNIMPVLLRRIGESVQDGPRFEVDTVAKGGYTLRMHWRHREARRRILRGPYTHVVLQAHSLSPLERRQEMVDYAARFGALIDRRHARPVLYETWARDPAHRFYRKHPVGTPEVMQRQVVDAYAEVASALSASVAPVGRAFSVARQRAPEVALLRRDGSHPTVHGSYLAALVLYASLTGVDPQRTTYHPFHIDDAEAQRLRAIAAEVAAVPPVSAVAASPGPTSIEADASYGPPAPPRATPPATPVDATAGLY